MCLPAGAGGTPNCNYGRLCGSLTIGGRDVGQILIGEGPRKSLCLRQDELPETSHLVRIAVVRKVCGFANIGEPEPSVTVTDDKFIPEPRVRMPRLPGRFARTTSQQRPNSRTP